MRISLRNQRELGLTLIELFVVLAVLTACGIFFALQPDRNGKARAYRIQCVNNLKQIGLATRVWEGDHADKFPMSLADTNGGTMSFVTGPNEWRHFQVMSNELSTPKLLLCPTDSDSLRAWATNFSKLSNSNLSYFVGVDSSEADPQGLLSGDRNITNGTPIRNGILELTTNSPAGWTDEMHRKVGNLTLADGSVQQVSGAGLRNAIENTGVFTNRLQMPILNP
jgi:hypothetical protein